MGNTAIHYACHWIIWTVFNLGKLVWVMAFYAGKQTKQFRSLLEFFTCKREIKHELGHSVFLYHIPIWHLRSGQYKYRLRTKLSYLWLIFTVVYLLHGKPKVRIVADNKRVEIDFSRTSFSQRCPLPLQKTCGFHCFPKDLYLPRKSVSVPLCSCFRSCLMNVVLLFVQQSPQI